MNVLATHVKELSAPERHKMLLPIPISYPELNDVVTQAKERLFACNVLTTPTFDVMKNLYAVARLSVDTLLDLVTHIESASADERVMWDLIFCHSKNHYIVLPNGSIKGNIDYGAYYRRMMDTQQSLLRVIASADRSNRELRPARISEQASSLMLTVGRPLHDLISYRAALIMIGVAGVDFDGSACIEDLDFIADHVDEVEALLPELVRRGSAERGLVKQLLSGSTALAEGNL